MSRTSLRIPGLSRLPPLERQWVRSQVRRHVREVAYRTRAEAVDEMRLIRMLSVRCSSTPDTRLAHRVEQAAHYIVLKDFEQSMLRAVKLPALR